MMAYISLMGTAVGYTEGLCPLMSERYEGRMTVVTRTLALVDY